MNKKVSYITNTSLVFFSSILAFFLLGKSEEACCRTSCSTTESIHFIKEVRIFSEEGDNTKCCLPTDTLPNNSNGSIVNPILQPLLLLEGNQPTSFLPQSVHFPFFSFVSLHEAQYLFEVLSKKYQGYIFWLCQLLL